MYADQLDVIVVRRALDPERLAAVGEYLDRDDANAAWARPNARMPIEDIQVLGSDAPATPTYSAPTGASLEAYLESAKGHQAATAGLFDADFDVTEAFEHVLGRFAGGRDVDIPVADDGRRSRGAVHGLLGTGEYLRRMPPPMGGASARWTGKPIWIEGAASFAAAQTRFNSGGLTDARIGATRTRTSIANYFNGTATDLGLVRNGVLLLQTGETLGQVQQRVLGDATSAALFTSAPGFFVLGARAGVRLSSHVDAIVIGEHLTDRNYRLYGSGADSPGANVQFRLQAHF